MIQAHFVPALLSPSRLREGVGVSSAKLKFEPCAELTRPRPLPQAGGEMKRSAILLQGLRQHIKLRQKTAHKAEQSRLKFNLPGTVNLFNPVSTSRHSRQAA